MKTPTLILVALTLTSCAIRPAICQNTYRPVRSTQDVTSHPSGTYIGGGTLSQSAQGTSAGVGGDQYRGILPSVPMGSVVGTANDRIGRVNGNAVSAPADTPTRNGLQPVRMGAAIGMPSDSVGRSIGGGSMRNGLQPTRFGAAAGMPGDGLRSDLRGTPMYNEQAMKRLRAANSQRPVQTSNQGQQSTPQQAATYGDSYDGKPKRNY